MLSRREMLVGVAAGLVAATRASSMAAPARPSTRVSFDVPPGACDCHTHIFGEPARYPFASTRTYTPEPALVEDLRVVHKALGISRVVIVQPSVYGINNSCTLDGMKQIGSSARGVAVIGDDTPDAELDRMHRAGVRGIRLNLATSGVTDPSVARGRFERAAARVKGRGWHIQINTGPAVIEGIGDLVKASAVPVVFDHFGGARASLGVQQPGFSTLVDLVRSARAYVKISAPYSASELPDYSDVAPLARALVAANPQRILWGTNWPHPDSAPVSGRKPTDVAPLQQIDDGRVLNLLPAWVPDAAMRKTILVDNPARLYGF